MAKTYYLAGPMSGYEKFNFPMFHRVAKLLREKHDMVIISPAEQDSPAVQAAAMASMDGKLVGPNNAVADTGETWGDILAKDVRIVADQVDGIVFLPSWERSRGARLEAFTGLMATKPFEFHLWHDEEESVAPAARSSILAAVYRSTMESLMEKRA